uniref:C2H2-type domain-containing protein n=1 Tax=Denticeps clupeoides TaxID=299321 RepID=A0AAY4EHD6_9TELE
MSAMNPPRESTEMAEHQPGLADPEDDKAPSYSCSVCGRSFPFQSSLSQHMRRHTGARPYKCPYCQHRTSQKGNLKVHIRSHKLGTLISPGLDEEEPEEEGEGLVEVGVSESLDGGSSPTRSSSACNGVLNGVEDARGKGQGRGVKRERSADSRPYRCKLCGYEARREDQLLSHIEKVHITAETEEDASPPPATPADVEEDFTCETCGQAFTQAWFLKAHMKKHTAELEHSCRICGRRFREAWFLKSHMKTHSGSKAPGRGRPRPDPEPPATINNVAQDPDTTAASGGACLYQICPKCGNLFHDRESLRAHDRAHGPGHAKPSRGAVDAGGGSSPAPKRRLLDYLGLRPAGEKLQDRRPGKRIPELDPVCSYQAWQLATRGRVLEPVDNAQRPASWDGDPPAGAVAYDRQSSRYVLAGHEKRVARRGSAGAGSHSSPGERTPESLSDSEYRPSSRQERRRSSQSKAHECFECGKVFRSRNQLTVHQRVHRRDGRGSGGDAEHGSPNGPNMLGHGATNSYTQSLAEAKTAPFSAAEEKPYICSLCDFITKDSSTFLSHVRHLHPGPRSSSSTLRAQESSPSLGLDRATPNSSFPKLKRALLQGSSHSPSPTLPLSEPPPSSLRPLAQASGCGSPAEPAVDLCTRASGVRGTLSSSDRPDGLPSHRCSYCSHSTRYPEVLWIHQTIAHRLSSSALVPKWAQRNGFKNIKEGLSLRRRTGPPPVLEGKECQPLPSIARSSRTRPPMSTNNQKKDKASSSHPQPSTSSSISKTPKANTRQRFEPTEDQLSRSRPKVDLYPKVISVGTLEKNAGTPPSSATSPKTGARLVERYVLPQEGLGFMLSSKHGLSEYGRSTPTKISPPPPQSRAKPANQHDQPAHSTTAGLMYGASQPQGGAVLGTPSPLKQESMAGTPETPLDILSFLKRTAIPMSWLRFTTAGVPPPRCWSIQAC